MRHVDDTALTGFDREALAYSRSRPDYPEALLGWFAESMLLGPGADAVDLGAGTGKFTRLLLRSGARVIAVEPVAGMRAQLLAALPGIEALAATAQALPLASHSVDALLCAQAFHWFATPVALAEIHRVLRPGGRLGLVWNVRDESVDWVWELTRLITPFEGDVPRYHSGRWRQAFSAGLFSEPRLTRLSYRHCGKPESVIIDRFASVSFIAAMNEPGKSALLERLGELAATHPALRGREQIEFPYETHAYWCEPLSLPAR